METTELVVVDKRSQAPTGDGPATSSVSWGEVLVCGCRDDDLAVLKGALGPSGPPIRTIREPVEAARQVVTRLPLAVVLGLRKRDRARLQIIPVLRAASKELPVIVVADEGSLDLERRARQAGIFYYFVRPLGSTEVQAVFEDLLRRARRGTSRQPTAGRADSKQRSGS